MGTIAHRFPLPTEGSLVLQVCGDWHSKFLNIPTFTKMIQMSRPIPREQRWLIINGDLYDLWYGMSKDPGFKEWKKRKGNAEDFFIPQFEDETKIVNDILDAVQVIFGRQIIWVGGNHDDPRLSNIIENIPDAYHHNFDLVKACHLQDRGIVYIKCNDWLMVGDGLCAITHGISHAKTTAHKHHYDECSTNAIFSHIHKYKSVPFKHLTGTKSVASTPTMANKDPDYLKNKNNDWDNGWISLVVTPDPREFSITPNIVRNDQLVLPDGRIL